MDTQNTTLKNKITIRYGTKEAEKLVKSMPASFRQAVKFASNIKEGELRVHLPDQNTLEIQGDKEGPSAAIEIRDYGLAKRFLKGADIGFAESFMAGEWDSPDVTALLVLFAQNRPYIINNYTRGPVARMVMRAIHFLNRNTKSQSKKNISAHYDLGNEFYETWLDGTMTYSSAVYGDGANDLRTAQLHKYRSLAQKIGLKPDHHVLEIGCGWGGFAEYAASEIGCRVTGLTISKEQLAYARERIAKKGLSDRVAFKFQDYRDETGQFDRIASIEMFEAVGEKYWPTYFQTLNRCLKPKGIAGLQIITIRDDHFDDYRANPDFIQRYIFPGGMLPPVNRLLQLGEKFGLSLHAERAFGLDYARTLEEWRERFVSAWPRIEKIGFDERFNRLWRFYLHYCEAGFKAGHIDVRQMAFVRQN